MPYTPRWPVQNVLAIQWVASGPPSSYGSAAPASGGFAVMQCLCVCLSCTVSDIFNVEYRRDVKVWVMDRLTSLKMASLHRSCTSSYSPTIATVLLSCIVSEIKQDIIRKSRFFMPHLHSTRAPRSSDDAMVVVFGIKVARCPCYNVVQNCWRKAEGCD